MKKNKRVALIFIFVIFILVFMVYKLIFVQFKDDNMALLITKYAGKNNRYFVMRSDLKKIDTIEIGPTCNYDTLIDLAKLRNLKKLSIVSKPFNGELYETWLIENKFHFKSSNLCDDDIKRVEKIEEDLAYVFQSCEYIESFYVGDVDVSEWRKVSGYNNERTFIQFNDISFLKNANHLKDLRIPFQEHIEDYSLINNISSLEILWINDSNINGGLDLRNNVEIRWVNISNTEISSFDCNSDNIEMIYISPDQKQLVEQYGEGISTNVIFDVEKYINNIGSSNVRASKLQIDVPEYEVTIDNETSVKNVEKRFAQAKEFICVDNDSMSMFPFFRARINGGGRFVCLISSDDDRFMAVYLSELSNISIMGIEVGDDINVVADVLGKADCCARYRRNGVLYEFENAKLIIYFDSNGLVVDSMEVYFDMDIFINNEMSDFEAEMEKVIG